MKSLSIVIPLVFLLACAQTNELAEVQLAQNWADEYLVEAKTPEERNLRLCFANVWVSESLKYNAQENLMTPTEAEAVINSLDNIVTRLRESSGAWQNTDMANAMNRFNEILVKLAKKRAIDFIGDAATLDWRGALTKLKILADKTRLTLGVLDDAKLFFTQVHDGTQTVDQGFVECTNRIDYNRSILRALDQ